MITGSHNPPEYNGLRPFAATALCMAMQIQQIFKLIQSDDFEIGEGTVKEVDAVTPYVR